MLAPPSPSTSPTTSPSRSLDAWISRLSGCKPLSEGDVKLLCAKVKEVLTDEPNLVQVSSPVNICGDIHGQFPDLLKLLRTGGSVAGTNYLFMGDYVDRGRHSLETIQLLLCLKLKHRERVTLLRGNHESRNVTMVFGFYDECLHKYGNTLVWKELTDLFDYLPVSGLVDGRILCMHGGLSPLVRHLDQINALDRVQEVGRVDAINDMLWSDPSEEHEGWAPSSRGTGHTFGPDVTTAFNYLNNVQLVARAHQVVMEGFDWTHHQGLVTVFSAPNYMYRVGNLAAILQVQQTSSSMLQFKEEERAMHGQGEKKPDSWMEYFV